MQTLMNGKKIQWLVAVALCAAVSVAHGRDNSVGDNYKDPRLDLSSTNKSVTVGSNSEVGDLDAVNGSIRVGDRSIVGDVDSVNGGIKIGDGVSARSVESVNGGIRLGADIVVDGDVDSVNGSIEARHGGEIAGDISTVNGGVSLRDVNVAGGLTTYNGTIELDGNTVIMGDLMVRKSKNSGWWNDSNRKATRVSIGSDVVIHGDLYFEKDVELYIDDGADIGDIHGDEHVVRGGLK